MLLNSMTTPMITRKTLKNIFLTCFLSIGFFARAHSLQKAIINSENGLAGYCNQRFAPPARSARLQTSLECLRSAAESDTEALPLDRAGILGWRCCRLFSAGVSSVKTCPLRFLGERTGRSLPVLLLLFYRIQLLHSVIIPA